MRNTGGRQPGYVAGHLLERVGAGYTTPYGDTGALEASLHHVIANPEESVERVQAGQVYIRKDLDWNGIAGTLSQLYQTLL